MDRVLLLCVILLLVRCYNMAILVDATIPNIATDESALLALKFGISHPNPDHNILASNWSTNTSVCNWIGVTCGSRHHRVIALNLSYMGLEGAIPQSLSNMSSLERIGLAFNGFSGYIPSSLFNISTLQAIDLGVNKLSGPMPSILFNMPSLQWINLYSNELSGRLPTDTFNHLPNLKRLQLSRNRFYDGLPSTLFSCKQLQDLSVWTNHFTGRVPPAIGNLTMLKKLYLAENNFAEYGFEGIVSTRGDVYSYGILLMETFTRKKPTDNIFVEEMNLKRWVEESLDDRSIVEIIDASLLGDERYNDAATMDSVLSIMGLALDCCVDSPEERINTRSIPIALNKIKSKFLQDFQRT
ncbi:probable LRR receptor-like serine/threonine-protein kinase At3g47570 isoform X3 [Carya illinoinensis]|uniref:probable LRR receptor-like serine/threonine-protein kinase At3g47570 isoform X3 n=1 Tax=Carya illinoinensis TaxID=32201 RepID=UPI001C722FF9|nr:probable LRR receptor-like serine/threonine-protein kinase At3g47570 isoform X3 [Carya illinoinensis]